MVSFDIAPIPLNLHRDGLTLRVGRAVFDRYQFSGGGTDRHTCRFELECPVSRDEMDVLLRQAEQRWDAALNTALQKVNA